MQRKCFRQDCQNMALEGGLYCAQHAEDVATQQKLEGGEQQQQQQQQQQQE